MLPFEQRNPYGSYMQFGAIDHQAIDAFRTGGLSALTTQSMGYQPANFAPTAMERVRANERTRSLEAFRSFIYRQDARASQMGSFISSQLFTEPGMREAVESMVGGGANMNELFSYALNSGTVSQFIGGSIQSLGSGALAISGGGARVGGRTVGGNSMLQQFAARGVFSHINRQMFAGGANNYSRTSGLDRDQVGALMTIMGEGGAFSGLDLGKLQQKAGSMSLQFNRGSLDQISKAVENASAAMAQIIDLYGNAKIPELLRKAATITGVTLDSTESAGLMNRRLQNIRTAAGVGGIDLRQAMDMSAANVQSLMGFGFGNRMAGALGIEAMSQAASLYAAGQGNVNNFFRGRRTLDSYRRDTLRDVGAMARDPLGARRFAVQLMLQNGTIDTASQDAVLAASSGAGPETAGDLDAAVLAATGIDLGGYIDSMGGTMAMLEQIQDGGHAIRHNARDMNQRRRVHVRNAIRRQLDLRGAGGLEAASNIFMNLGEATSTDLMQALDRKSGDDELRRIIARDVVGRGDVGGYLQSVRDLRAAGGGGSFVSLLRDSTASYRGNAIAASFIPEADLRVQELRRARGEVLTADQLRQVRDASFGQGLFDALSGNSPTHTMMLMNAARPDLVAGLSVSERIILDPSRYRDAHGNIKSGELEQMAKHLTNQMSGITGGKELMMRRFGLHRGSFAGAVGTNLTADQQASLMSMLDDPSLLQDIFANYKMTSATGTDGLVSTMFAHSADYAKFGMQGAWRLGHALQGIRDRVGGAAGYRFGMMGKSLISGRTHMGREMDDAEIRELMALAREELSSYAGLRGLGADTAINIGSSFRGVGTHMLAQFQMRNRVLLQAEEDGKSVDKDERKFLADVIEGLKAAGLRATESDGMSLNGTLRLEGDKMKLEAMMRDHQTDASSAAPTPGK